MRDAPGLARGLVPCSGLAEAHAPGGAWASESVSACAPNPDQSWHCPRRSTNLAIRLPSSLKNRLTIFAR